MAVLTRMLCLCVACALLGGMAGADQRFQLANGVRVVIMHVPDAPRQSTFTFLPVHMANDGPGRAQWAHLLEHHVIRSTDPHSLEPEGMRLNGETMHGVLRLDTYAEPDAWKAALQRHATWLTARTFSAEVHDREIARIESEEQSTAAGCFTAKFAIAAWNQVVRHGRKHAAVHGDVASAKISEVNSYAAARLPIDDGVLIATIGPAASASVRAEIERLLAEVESNRGRGPSAAIEQADLAGRFDATWDLPNHHAMRWWRLPDEKPRTLAIAMLASQLIQMRLRAYPALGAGGLNALVFPHVPTPDGGFLIVDVCMPSDADSVEIWAALDELMKSAFTAVQPKQFGAMFAMQVTAEPDFGQLRAMMGPSGDLAEAQWLLTMMTLEHSFHAEMGQVREAFERIDDESFATIRDLLVTGPSGTLILSPAE